MGWEEAGLCGDLKKNLDDAGTVVALGVGDRRAVAPWVDLEMYNQHFLILGNF